METDKHRQYPYELWDTASANALGAYKTEAAALRVVRREVEAFGPDAPEVLALSLICLDGPPERGPMAAGAELVERAVRAAEAHPAAAVSTRAPR
jgi:hypothetical protein